MRTRISLSTGVELDVLQSGDPAGVPLLLLHGYSDSALSLAPLMTELPSQIRAIAITQRGHGDSSKPTEAYGFADLVADAAGALDHLGVGRAVIYGHSMGSVIAQMFAIAHPERTIALVLEGAAPGFAGIPIVESMYEEAIVHLEDPIDPVFARDFQESTLAQPINGELLELTVRETCKLPARAWKRLAQELLAHDLEPQLSRIAAPTLILWGDRDRFACRPEQDRLFAGIRRCELVTFQGVGHAPHWEEPARTARRITDFVQRHAASVAAEGA